MILKGVHKNVVEVVQPGDESIERVLIFLKPDSDAVRVGRAEEKAQEYAAGLVTWRVGPPWRVWGAALALAAALTAVLWWLL